MSIFFSEGTKKTEAQGPGSNSDPRALLEQELISAVGFSSYTTTIAQKIWISINIAFSCQEKPALKKKKSLLCSRIDIDSLKNILQTGAQKAKSQINLVTDVD